MTDQAISPLRQRMIDDMTIRKLGAKTQAGYIRAVKNFAAFLGHSPDRAKVEDIRRYQLHLASSGLGVPSVNATMTALRFFFKVTLRRGAVVEDIVFAREPRRLPVVLSPEEVARLLAAAPDIQCPSRFEHRLRRRSSRLRSHLAQGRRYRQHPHAGPGRSGQRPQGPLRDAVAAVAPPVAALVAGEATKGVAVPRPGSRRAPHRAAAQPRHTRGRTTRRDRQARRHAHPAA